MTPAHSRSLSGLASRLAGDRRGVTTIEFAMLLPVLLTLIFGAIEMGHLMGIRANLEGALMDASRQAAAQLNLDEDTRDELMRALINERMQPIALAKDQQLTIETEVYRDFATSYPEPFDDQDGNGAWTAGGTNRAAEPFDDRNGNGKWDNAVLLGGKFGGPGDVVGYKATYPAPLYFSFFLGDPETFSVDLTATAVRRNEPEQKL